MLLDRATILSQTFRKATSISGAWNRSVNLLIFVVWPRFMCCCYSSCMRICVKDVSISPSFSTERITWAMNDSDVNCRFVGNDQPAMNLRKRILRFFIFPLMLILLLLLLIMNSLYIVANPMNDCGCTWNTRCPVFMVITAAMKRRKGSDPTELTAWDMSLL